MQAAAPRFPRVVLLGDVFLVTSGVSWLSCWQNCSVSIFRLRGPILVSVLSVFVLLLGVTPAHAASLGKLKVSIVAPKGVAVSVAMIKSSKRVVYTKPGSLSSATVTKKVPAGTWKPGLSPVKLGDDFYVPTVNKSAVKVKKGKTASVKVTYTKEPVASNLSVAQVGKFSTTVTFTRPSAKSEVAARIVEGETAPASIRHGKGMRIVEDAAISTDLKVNKTYTVGVFTKVGPYWLGPVAATVLTKNADPQVAVERQALQAIKDANPEYIDDYYWNSENHCAWSSVTCNEDGFVNSLSLDYGWGNNLPAEIGDFKHLKKLHLIYNSSLKELPPEIGNLTELEELSLFGSRVESLPREIGNLTELTYLDTEDTRIGSVPAEIGNLTKLETLNLSFSGLRSLPPEIGNLKKLQRLDLHANGLSTLPPEIGGLESLVNLSLQQNELTTLPPEIGSLAALKYLNLWLNDVTSLPAEMGSLSSLDVLYVNQNKLHGDISPWIRGLKTSGITTMALYLNGCMNVGGDADLEQWLDDMDTGWRYGCKDM